MKTAIVELQSYDDVPTLQDKMLWARAPRIVLVWPTDRAPRLQGVLDLVRLRRYAARLGARLALVSRDPRVRAWARQARLPVFATLQEAQQRPWRVPRRRRLRRPYRRVRPRIRPLPPRATLPLPRGIRVGALLAGLGAWLALLAFIVPAARITLRPRLEVQTVTVALPLGQTAGLPLQRIGVEVRTTVRRPVQGQRLWPRRAAHGEVVFTNLGLDPVTIPAGLPLHTVHPPRVTFEVVQGGQVPAGVGQQAAFPVVALQPGTVGNRPAGDVALLPPPWDVQVTASNPTPTQGGADALVPWPTAADYAALRRQAEAELRRLAAQQLAAQTALWIPESINLVRTLAVRYEPAEPAATATLSLTLMQRYEAWAVPEDALQARLLAVLDEHLPPRRQVLPKSLTWEPDPAGPVRQGPRTWIWTITAQRWVYRAPDWRLVASHLRGLPQVEAEQYLQQTWDLTSAPTLQIWPSFWPWLPWWTERLYLQIQPTSGASGAALLPDTPKGP